MWATPFSSPSPPRGSAYHDELRWPSLLAWVVSQAFEPWSTMSLRPVLYCRLYAKQPASTGQMTTTSNYILIQVNGGGS